MVSFSFVSNYILASTLISSVILWLFSIILFSHFFLFFPLCFITNLIVLWSEKMIGMISIFLNFWRHILWLPHYLSWEMFHVYLKRKECIFFCYQMKCFLSLSIYMCLCVCVLVAESCPTLCGSMDCSPPGSSVCGFSRQEYWSGLPCPLPGYLPNPEIEPRSPKLQKRHQGRPYILTSYKIDIKIKTV